MDLSQAITQVISQKPKIPFDITIPEKPDTAFYHFMNTHNEYIKYLAPDMQKYTIDYLSTIATCHERLLQKNTLS